MNESFNLNARNKIKPHIVGLGPGQVADFPRTSYNSVLTTLSNLKKIFPERQYFYELIDEYVKVIRKK